MQELLQSQAQPLTAAQIAQIQAQIQAQALGQLQPQPQQAQPSPKPRQNQPLLQIQAPQQAQLPPPKSQLWNLQDVDIRTLIEQVSKETGKNFIVDPRVQGKVTFISSTPLISDELYQVFLAILSAHGFAATPSSHAIKIVPIYEANYQPVPTVRPKATNTDNGEFIVQVAAVQNLSASQLATTLRPLLPPSSQIVAYPQTNSLIITGSSDKMAQIDQIIKGLDQPTASNIEIIPLHYAIASQIIATLKPMLPVAAQGQPGSNINISADIGGNSILISGPPVDRARIKSIIKQMDVLQSTTVTQNIVSVVGLHYLKARDFAPVLISLVTGQSRSSTSSNSSGDNTPGGPSDSDFNIGGNGGSSGNGGSGYGGYSSNSSNYGGNYGSSGQPSGLNLTLPSLEKVTGIGGGGGETNGSGTGSSSNPNNIQIVAEETTNSIVISAPPKDMDKLKSIIAQLDVQPQQVLIEAIIVEVDESVVENLGIQWGATLPSGVNMTDSFASMTGAGVGIGVVDFGRIRAIINYLTTDTSSNILSTPSLVVLNNQKAQILVGQQVSFVTGSYAQTGTQAGSTSTVTPFTTTNQQNVALTLNVIPQIGPDGTIRLLIKQGNQTLSGATINQNPVVNEADLATTILMKSNQILVLGGLISNDFADTTQRVPFLSKVPLVGEFFKNRNPDDTKKNLMVFLHPVILNTQTQQDTQSSARYGMIRELELQKQRAASPLGVAGANPLLPQWKPVHIPEPYPTND